MMQELVADNVQNEIIIVTIAFTTICHLHPPTPDSNMLLTPPQGSAKLIPNHFNAFPGRGGMFTTLARKTKCSVIPIGFCHCNFIKRG